MRHWISVVFASVLTALALVFIVHGLQRSGLSQNHFVFDRGYFGATKH